MLRDARRCYLHHMTRITVSLEDETAETIADMAKVERRSVSAEIAMAVDQWVLDFRETQAQAEFESQPKKQPK